MEELKKWVGHKIYIAIMLAAVIVVVCFLTACQPTPPKPIVQNKNDDDLKNAIEQTATPTEQIIEVVQPTETVKPQIIVEDVSSNSSNTVTVDIHAEVINNQPDNIPVARITPYKYTQEEIMRMVEVFFGNTQLYTKEWIKEDYDYFILQKQYQMNDPEQLQAYADDRDIEDLSVAKAQIQEAIDRFINQRSQALEKRVAIDFESAVNGEYGLNALIKTRDGFWGNVNSYAMTAFNDDDIYFRSRDFYPEEHIGLDCTDEAFLNAKQMAIQMVSDMQIVNILFGDAYMVKDISHTDNGPYWNGREYYVFCFDAVIGESVLDNNKSWVVPPALVDMSGKDGYENVAPIHYDKVLPYDRMEVWVEGDKIVQFKYRNPIKVAQIINDNVAIDVDYLEAIENAKQFAYTAFIDPRGNSLEYRLNIDRIELVLVRIKEKDTDGYIVVPAWSFCGSHSRKVNPENKNSLARADENGWLTDEGVEGSSDVLITINALDGTVIDISHGY